MSGGRTCWNSFEMDPCTGSYRWQIAWLHSRPGCHWIMLMMVNWFGGSGWWCIRRNVLEEVERWRKSEGGAASDLGRIWQCTQATRQEVTSPSYQTQCSWLWFAACPIATMSFNPTNTSKPCIPMWGTWRSWLISWMKMEAWKSHTFCSQCASANLSRMHWMKRIWEYIPTGKW